MEYAQLNRLPRWSHFGIAVVLSGLVLLFRFAIGGFMGESAPFLFASIAVLVSAYIGGFWPGLIATAITTIGGATLFLLPKAHLMSETQQRVIVGANITVCISISLMCGALRASEFRAAKVADQERATNEKLNALINSITDALIIFSRDLRIVSFNDAAATLWKLTTAHIGSDIAGALPRDVYEAIVEPSRTTLDLGISSSIEVTVKEMEKSFEVLSFPSEEGLLVYFRDITSRVAADTAIENLVEEQRKANAFLDSLLTHAPVGFAFFSRDYRYERINEVLAEINGIPMEEHIGKKIGELLPVNAPTVEPIIDEVFATGRAVDQLEIRGETPKEPGKKRHWLTGFYPVADTNGAIRSVGAVIIEITQRKLVEEQLRESESRFRNLADDAPMMIWICNPDGSAQWFNRPWLDFRGLSLDEAISEGCFANIHPDDEPWVNETYREAFAKGEPFSVEYRTLQASDEYRWIHVKANPVYHGGGQHPTSYLMSSIDVTDRTTMEEHLRRSLANERAARSEAENANRLKDEFLAGLSHELRTPLTTMLGWSELLMRPSVRESELNDGLQVIHRSSKLQLQIINDLLDMSRISVGKISLELEYADMFDTVQSVISLVQPSAAEKGIVVSFHAPTEPLVVRIDTDRVTQILWNLLSNAIKFTPKEGRVSVEIRAEGNKVLVSIQDTGIGLEPSFLPFVFDRFRQADAGRSRRHGGLGLGLAIAKQLAELHGGDIEAQSDGAEKGSTFTLVLPKAEMAPSFSQPQPELETPAPETRRLVNKCVLLVEDDMGSRELLTKILELEGAQVISASSAPLARKLIREVGPDLLISDIGLPEEDGYQLMRSIRSASGTEHSLIPAIALTAFAGGDDQVRAFEAGFSMFLSKPVDPEDLINAVLEVERQKMPG